MRDNAHEFRLSNGSAALAFPTTGGRSYTASLAIVDEADHTEDLDGLLNAVKPTIDAGGRLVLLSTVDKSRPESPFKRIYRAAVAGENDYAPIFLPWDAHPGRTPQWYVEQARDIRARTGGLDDLYQEYPATDREALAPRAVDKFFPMAWLNRCYAPVKIKDFRFKPDDDPGAAGSLQFLLVHVPPQPGHSYVIGADPAEGNPQSDESAAVVLDAANAEQVATLGLRCDPEMFAVHLGRLAAAYGGADILVERNNHGHAVILALRQLGAPLLRGPDGELGWATTAASKHLAFDQAAGDMRESELRLHDETTYWQLAAIDGATLAAPPGQHDDRAMACVLALAARRDAGGPHRGASAGDPADEDQTYGSSDRERDRSILSTGQAQCSSDSSRVGWAEAVEGRRSGALGGHPATETAATESGTGAGVSGRNRRRGRGLSGAAVARGQSKVQGTGTRPSRVTSVTGDSAPERRCRNDGKHGKCRKRRERGGTMATNPRSRRNPMKMMLNPKTMPGPKPIAQPAIATASRDRWPRPRAMPNPRSMLSPRSRSSCRGRTWRCSGRGRASAMP